MRKPSKFTETELRRALRAARKERVPARIDLMPDGRISIIPVLEGDLTEAVTGATDMNEWDAVGS